MSLNIRNIKPPYLQYLWLYSIFLLVVKLMFLPLVYHSAESNIFISTQVLNEFVSAFNKKLKSSWSDIINSLKEITENFIILNNTADIIKEACTIAQKCQFSYYDSLIIAAALDCGCTTLYSEDMQHNQVVEGLLTIVNPFLLP